MTTPLIFETTSSGERAYDIFSKLMTQRIIFIGQPIDSDVANIVCAQLNHLESISEEPVQLYINSPGGHVTDTLAIYDTIQYVNVPVHTLCIGQAASGAALLLLSGAKGNRRALPHSEIMLHQPSGGMMGKVTDLVNHIKQIEKQKRQLNEIVKKHTNLSMDDVNTLLEWDAFMGADEAKEKSIIDTIISKKKKIML